ncbi:hypothetical protein EXIGLDRAFT_90050 [Exidia glandulosa HHB12029]|uniref:Uncharacterized protein n=1 Tax=Exidia glandulosa HHB12029 TaxID=1314781 RepID=A0A165NVY4_EXIGL|nr:hypothetical protein EXIGLDRAFT_90050 [Exidia glandulosa HHB12029]
MHDTPVHPALQSLRSTSTRLPNDIYRLHVSIATFRCVHRRPPARQCRLREGAVPNLTSTSARNACEGE